MSTQEISHSDWSRFLDDFSRQHQGWLTRVEVRRPDIGDKIEAEGLPFHGITYDLKGSSRNNISIVLGKNTVENETHTIVNPTHVRFEQADQGGIQSIEVESEDGAKAIVRFISAMRPDQVDRM
jgi:hypothetical protein